MRKYFNSIFQTAKDNDCNLKDLLLVILIPDVLYPLIRREN